MKKIICFMLSLIMVLSLAACGNNAEPPTSPSNSASQTASPEMESITEETIKADEASTTLLVENLLMNDATTAAFDTLNEYEQKLHSLGFIEFKADLWRASPDSAPAMSPVELTFNDSAFRLVFNYTSVDYATGENILVNNWVLYGTKADSALNVSNFQPDNFEAYDSIDLSALNSNDTSFVHTIAYMMYNMENDTPVDFTSCEAHYYSATGNVYNLVYEYEDASQGTYNTPMVLATTEEDIDATVDWDYYQDILPPADAKPAAHMTIRCGDTDYLYYYEEGMTIADWAKDVNYDVDGWSVVSDGTCLSPDDKWVIADINTPIEEMVDENGMIVAERSMF